MPEYIHRIYKQELNGYATDPDQGISNAQSPLFDRGLTLGNAVNLGIVASYSKRVTNTGYRAVVGQLGNARVNEAVNVASSLTPYIALALASPQTAAITIPLLAATEVITTGIENAVDTHETNLENQRKTDERGSLIQLGAGDYYG